MREIVKKIGEIFLDLLQTFIFAACIFLICYWFLFQPHQVKGLSMFPNFHDEDFLLTNKISYRFHLPQRFDVVVFKAPPSEPCSADECEYIKRVIGLPRESIMLSNSSFYVNGKILEERYIPSRTITSPGMYMREGSAIILGENEYLLIGDNRPHSRDGREFGPINLRAIIGKAWIRYWPINQAGLIKHYE